MSKNLFDYATKELSQDAFLRWLLENFDDPIVGKASRKLIGRLAAVCGDNEFDASKITNVITWSQWKHIDIFADVYVGNAKYAIVIEDKTYSNEHHQLSTYNDSLGTLKGYKAIYRIFYKTAHIYEDELGRVKDAEWTIFDLNAICDVFRDFEDSQNDILSQYASYVISKTEQENSVSNKPLEEWNQEEWKTYIRLKLTPTLQEKVGKAIEVYTWAYQGRYVSAGVYYPNKIFEKNKPLIELFFRSWGGIAGNLHVESLGNRDNWDVNHTTPEFIERFNAMFREGKLPSFKRINTKHCIAKLVDPIDKSIGVEEVTEKLVEITQEFCRFFNELEQL